MRTLLRAPNWVGDVVMSLPALRALRASSPEDRLVVLCRPWVADLYRLLPEVDEVLVEDPKEHAGRAGLERLSAVLRDARLDRAVLLPRSFVTAWTVFRAGIPERVGYRGELRSPLLTRAVPMRLGPGEHEVFRHLRLVEAAGARPSGPPDTSFPVAAGLRQSARRLLDSAGVGAGPFVAAHVASFAHAAKRWSLSRFAETLDALSERHGHAAVLLGSASEAAVNGEARALARKARVLDLSGKSTLPDVLGILSLASLFVGNDSGVSHLAGAVGTPAVVAFTSTDPDATRPWDGPRPGGRPARVAVARARPLCAPCRFRVCPIDARCQADLSVASVLAAAEELLGEAAPQGPRRESAARDSATQSAASGSPSEARRDASAPARP